MKRRIVALSVIAVGLIAAGGSCKPRSFPNCDAMHEQFQGGVARVGAVDYRPNGGTAKYKPYYSDAWYNANTARDRDNDGIACEQ
ncbi:MAG: excalibur calcium-binding domain-containing protein [Acidimicrobiales bacterium]|nr:excalibur calcium-binding domain-containing protein [Acidimicrobiales bacterium]